MGLVPATPKLFTHFFSNHHQSMGGENGYLFPLAVDEAILFPLAQDSADGVKRGTSHLRQILPGEGEID